MSDPYSSDPHYRELVRILVEILARGRGRPVISNVGPGGTARERKGPPPDPVPLVVRPCEEVQ